MKKKNRGSGPVWGSPDYLVMKFDDIDAVRKLPRSCKAVRSVRRLVDGARTPENRLSVYEVYATSGVGAAGPVTQTVAQLSMGLNGRGRQEHYVNALAKLLNSGKFLVLDMWVDAADDLMDVLVAFDPRGGH